MRRRLVTALLVSSAAAAGALPLIAWAGPGGGDYPDLRADAPEDAYLQRYGTSSPRLLVRFDGFVTNVGDGPLDVEGNPAAGAMMQRVRTAGSLEDEQEVPVDYEEDDGHDHWHLMRVMRYSLRAGTSAGSALVAPGQKVGFCLVDSQPAPQPSPPRESQLYSTSASFNQGFCGVGKPGLTSLRMGVSVGWRDVYHDGLPFQWVDVSETVPGTYYVAAEADPEDIIAETSESNPPAFNTTPVTVPGHVATAVGPVDVANGTATDVTLTARTVGSPGVRAFRVTRAPSGGTLDVAVGQTFTGDTVTYTPRPGFSGTDSFAFAAVTTTGDTRGFPRTPPQATATLQVGAAQAAQPSVAISGAPASVVAGTAVQLQAVVSGAPAGVTWTASAGSVDGGGLFRAPASVPPGGAVTVRATSTAAPTAAAEAVIGVTPAPVPVAAPNPGPGTVAGLPGPVALKRSGRILVVRVTPPQGGRLAIAAVRGRRAVAVCVRRVGAGRRTACALRLPARVSGKPVKVVVSLRATGVRWSARAVSAR